MNKEDGIVEKVAWVIAILSGLGLLSIIFGVNTNSLSDTKWFCGAYLVSTITIYYYEHVKIKES